MVRGGCSGAFVPAPRRYSVLRRVEPAFYGFLLFLERERRAWMIP